MTAVLLLLWLAIAVVQTVRLQILKKELALFRRDLESLEADREFYRRIYGNR